MQSVATNLKPILEQELAALQRMASALLGEQEALKQQDQESLLRHVQEKSTLAGEIDTLVRQCDQILRSNSLAEGMQGLTQLKESLGAANPLAGLMQSIASASDQCRKQNEINGKIVQQSSHELRSKIAILQGGTMDPDGYNSDGDVANNKTSNIIGRA